MEDEVFTIVVMTLAGTVTDVVGPFYGETGAERWAREHVETGNYRYAVRRLTERTIWEAEHK